MYDYIVLTKARGSFVLSRLLVVLSGPNALEAFSCLVAGFNSESENKDVFISSVSDTVTLGRVLMSGTLAGLPRRF